LSKLRRNILYNLSGQLLLVILGFASARYIYRGLGGDVLGIIYFVMMLNNVLAGVLELGLGATVVKEVAAHSAADDAYTRRIIRVGALYFWVGFAVVAGLQVLAAPWIVDVWLQLEELPRDDSVAMMRILGPMVFLAFPKTFYTCVFRGLQRMGITNVIDVSAIAAQQLGVVLLIASDQTLYPVVLWIALTYVLRVAAYLVALGRTYSWRTLLPAYDAEVVSRNASFVRQMAGMSVLGLLQGQGDKLVISKLLPMSYTGWYGFAYGTVGKGTKVTGAIASAVFPRLSEMARAGDPHALRDFYVGVQTLMALGLVPVFAAIPFAARPLFVHVLDTVAMTALWWPTSLLALGFYMQGTVMTPHFLALAVERPDIALKQGIYGFFTVLPLTVALIAWLGLTGAALGWLAYQVLAYSYAVRRIYAECLQISPWRFYREIGQSLSMALVTYGAAFAGLWYTVGFSIPWAAAGFTSGSLLYLGLVWLLGGEHARQELKGVLRRLRLTRGANA